MSPRRSVVIMDVEMPGIGGLEATRRLTNLLRGVRVIGYSSHDVSEGKRTAGATDLY